MPLPAVVIYLLVLVEPKSKELPLLVECLTKAIGISLAVATVFRQQNKNSVLLARLFLNR